MVSDGVSSVRACSAHTKLLGQNHVSKGVDQTSPTFLTIGEQIVILLYLKGTSLLVGGPKFLKQRGAGRS